MSFQGRFQTKALESIWLGGEVLAAASAGTTGNILVLMYDTSGDILLATGTDVPVDTTDGYAKGCRFIDRDVGAGISGVYENVGTNSSCNFDAITASMAEINDALDGNTATAAEITQAADLSAQIMSEGAGFAGTETIYASSVVQHGDVIKTELLIDLTDAKSSTTDLDIIGNSGVSHIGQITAALNGTIMYGQVTCLETPATGVDDIDLYAADEGTGAFDGGVGALTETALVTKGASWTASVTPVIMENLPAADQYLYLTSGAAGTAATYTAGRFLIELWGV